MNNSCFTMHGNEYEIRYQNKELVILKKIGDTFVLLSNDENKKIIELLNARYSYVYDSDLLLNLVNSNEKIENKPYIQNFLNWLENTIPENCRNNFYNNIETISTSLKLDINFSNFKMNSQKENVAVCAGYNTCENSLSMDEESLFMLWQMVQKTNDPQEFYWREYSKTLLHELSHMSSSKYDKTTGISLCGFDKFPPETEEDKNRGLTEGFTEIIAMTGVPRTIEISSGYYIETSLVAQLIQIIGLDVFSRSYFSNLGITEIKEKLQNIINDDNKSFKLFRDIELNFQIGYLSEKQNVLGNIQSTILDYLDKKIEILLLNNNLDEINQIITNFQQMLITPHKLEIMLKNPNDYIGVEESVSKFEKIKEKYSPNLELHESSSQK